MTYIFLEREKIDKAQFILDRSGPVLKLCKILWPHLTTKCCAFSVYHSRKLRMRIPFYTKNFEILTKFSDSTAEKLSMCKILRPYNS